VTTGRRTDMRKTDRGRGWLLFFYSVPSSPVSNRMKIWRRLSKAGAIQIKGAAYILPLNEEHYEFCQWLVAEVASMGGEAAFTGVGGIDSMKDQEIVDLFKSHKDKDYEAINNALDDLDTRVDSIRKGSNVRDVNTLLGQIGRLSKNYEEALKTDFFPSKTGAELRSRLNALKGITKGLSVAAPAAKPAVVPPRMPEDFQKMIWATRKRPFIDRMASAWLIRKFIDSEAIFMLVDENDLAALGKGHVTFDVSGGTFTHMGNLCTFEVLVKSFRLKDSAIRKIAEIVHELDIKDDKYGNAESAGLEEILSGLRKAVKDDHELLERGMSVFEMLYMSKAGGQHG